MCDLPRTTYEHNLKRFRFARNSPVQGLTSHDVQQFNNTMLGGDDVHAVKFVQQHKLPDSLEPYEPATERTRQLFILALIGGAAFFMRFKGGWMHQKDA
mgnify:CR=1 FL=1